MNRSLGQQVRRLGRATRRPRHTIRHLRRRSAHAWASRRAEEFSDLAATIDRELWQESCAWVEEFRQQPIPPAVSSLSDRQAGGPGHLPALHFLVRLLRPQSVVETGVAAGWSTSAILGALETNGQGHLWSSDLTYQARGVVGDFGDYHAAMVPASLRHRWTLASDGDRENLPRILTEAEKLDLVHYDSDKSYEGRAFAFGLLLPRISDDSVVMVDDVGNNMQFRAMTSDLGWPWRVFRKPGKGYVGVVAPPGSRLGDLL